MAIYDPNIVLTDADREAIALLAQLILAASGEDSSSNLAPETAPLSISQAMRLLDLLEQLVTSKKFVEGAYFAEGVANGEGWEDDRLREIYLSWRKRFGFTRVASTYSWTDFVVRSGFSTGPNAWMWPAMGRARTVVMTYDHFTKMERRLAKAAGLHPRVVRLIEALIEDGRAQIEGIRERRISVSPGTIRSFADKFLSDLKRAMHGKERRSMSRRKLVAMTTLVMDSGALFITRDWTATATISMIGSTFPDLTD